MKRRLPTSPDPDNVHAWRIAVSKELPGLDIFDVERILRLMSSAWTKGVIDAERAYRDQESNEEKVA